MDTGFRSLSGVQRLKFTLMEESGRSVDSAWFTIAKAYPTPIPINILKIGPAIVAVIAIFPYPLLVIARSAFMSPKQLPHDMIVMDNRASGSPVTNLKIVKISITIPQANWSHMMHMKKDKKVQKVIKPGGAVEVLVLNKMKTPMNAPRMANYTEL